MVKNPLMLLKDYSLNNQYPVKAAVTYVKEEDEPLNK